MIENENAAYSVPAWHGLGAILGEASLPEFISAANMDYEVEKRDAYVRNANGDFVAVPNQQHVVRVTDEKVVSLSTVTDRYVPMQIRTLVELATPFVEGGWAMPDATFLLYEGNSEVISLALKGETTTQSDPSSWKHFLLLQNFHGRGTVRGKVTTVRTVCHNTATVAFAPGADFAIKHCSTVDQQVREAMSKMDGIHYAISKQMEALERFSGITVDPEKFMRQLLGLEDKKPDEISSRAKNHLDALIDAMERSPGVSGHMTGLDAFNAVTYITTHRTGTQGREKVVASLLDGARASMQKKAANMLEKLAA